MKVRLLRFVLCHEYIPYRSIYLCNWHSQNKPALFLKNCKMRRQMFEYEKNNFGTGPKIGLNDNVNGIIYFSNWPKYL